jgi:hypothetical protein
MNVRSGKKHNIYACRIATPSSIGNRANMISDPMGQDKTKPESGENEIGTKDETIINNE